jgi:phage RecT family recombinase
VSDQVAKFDMRTWAVTMVKPQVSALLPKGEADWPAFEVSVRTAVLNNPALARAIAENPNSALLSILKCARAGLSLNPVDEHFALIPYGGKNPKVDGQIMVRGWIHLGYRSGNIELIDADVIYKQEYDSKLPFRRPDGSINHSANPIERDNYKQADIVGAYAQAKLRGGRFVPAFLSIKEIEKRRKMGFGDTPAWNNFYERMCCVKALKALYRTGFIPMSPEIKVAMAEDDATEIAAEAAKTPQTPPLSRASVEAWPEGWDAGHKHQYKETDKNPMPNEEEADAMAQGALNALLSERGAPAGELDLITKHLFKKPIEIQELTADQAKRCMAYLREEDKE